MISMAQIVVLDIRRSKLGTNSDWSEKWDPQGENPRTESIYAQLIGSKVNY